jgi:hypothetical protein
LETLALLMSVKKKRSWIFAILVATVFPAIAIHTSCVAVMGPGTWGSGLEEQTPEILSAASNPAVQAYSREFSRQPEETPRLDLPQGLDAGSLQGTVVWVDGAGEKGLWAIQTYDGKNWTEGQHLYRWQDPGRQEAGADGDPPLRAGNLEEISIAPDRIVEQPAFIEGDGKASLVYGCWRSWAIPAVEKLKRYARSWFDQELRPEFGLYIYDLESRQNEYFGPGHSLKVSPDRRRGVLLRSGALGAGYYSIHVWDFASGHVETVISLREADEGSGQSFGYRWSSDSQALQISGMTGGFERRKRLPATEFNLIYLVEGQGIYEGKE